MCELGFGAVRDNNYVRFKLKRGSVYIKKSPHELNVLSSFSPQIGRMGVVVENKSQQCNQLMSCAADG